MAKINKLYVYGSIIAVIAIVVVLFAFSNKPNDVPTEKPNITTLVTFNEKLGADVCTQDGKPIIRLFSTTWCPHCKWITGTYESTVQKYVDEGKIVAHHWELDIKDDTLTSEDEGEVPESEEDLFVNFNPQQSIPTFVFGCKYYRTGNGYETEGNLLAEEAEFEYVIERLIQETQ
jgi:thiol-disulfide isomerase/thioredoxin